MSRYAYVGHMIALIGLALAAKSEPESKKR